MNCYLKRILVMAVLLISTAGGCLFSPRLDVRTPAGRTQAVEAYLNEFCSPVLMETNLGGAIREVLMRMPPDALEIVLDRRRPVLFTEVFDAGTAQFASSSEVIVGKSDRPAFQDGMTILKLSTALNAGPKEAAVGIVAHELAHRVLDHVRRGKTSCNAEREANRLIKEWGFVKEYETASGEFGKEKAGDNVASCQEESQEAKDGN